MMLWFTWRQLRSQTLVTAAALTVLGVLLLALLPTVTDLYANVAACKSDCAGALSVFLARFRGSAAFPAYLTALAAVYVLPAAIGMFWGAPMIARELETGTHRLAWNQSITRTRWLAVKLVAGSALAATSTALLTWAVTTWSQRFDNASHDRMLPFLYGARGIVPVGYALFAFLLGVTIGMLMRRVVSAMALTLAIYVVALAAMPLWLRPHLVAPQHDTIPLTADNIQGLSFNEESGTMDVVGRDIEGTWSGRKPESSPAWPPCSPSSASGGSATGSSDHWPGRWSSLAALGGHALDEVPLADAEQQQHRDGDDQ